MDRKGLVGVVIGVLGLLLGLAAVLWNAVQFAVIAGALALVAGVAVARLVHLLRRATSQIEELSGELDELRDTIEEESGRRADLENQLASRIQLTSVRKGTQFDALTDPSTGLFSEGYFTVALDARIASARRNLKPVAVVVMEVIEGLRDGTPRPADANAVAGSIGQTIRESDTACRLMDGGFALVLEDTSETGAIWTVERIRRALAASEPDLTLWAGVACYPAHGFTTEDVLDRADVALDMAREWRQDRIEVATAE